MSSIRKLRLLVLEKCYRNCKGCCNKDWDLGKLPVAQNFTGYDEIMLTGGEPLILPDVVKKVSIEIRQQNPTAKIFVYTTIFDYRAVDVLSYCDGLTATIHNDNRYNINVDIINFLILDENIRDTIYEPKSLRLNLFRGVPLDTSKLLCQWEVKDNIDWIPNCPLPEGETFQRLLPY